MFLKSFYLNGKFDSEVNIPIPLTVYNLNTAAFCQCRIRVVIEKLEWTMKQTEVFKNNKPCKW